MLSSQKLLCHECQDTCPQWFNKQLVHLYYILYIFQYNEQVILTYYMGVVVVTYGRTLTGTHFPYTNALRAPSTSR